MRLCGGSSEEAISETDELGEEGDKENAAEQNNEHRKRRRDNKKAMERSV
jgi:hypothetical protein